MAGDKFMSKMHLKQPCFTYSACGPFTKNKGKNWKLYANKKYRPSLQKWVDKACFQHDMTYDKSKDLIKKNSIRQSFKR